MVQERKDITAFVGMSKIVRRAILDTYGDFAKDEPRYQAWAIDGYKKLVRETLKSGKRYAVININKNLNSAILPCDFKEEIFVGLIDNCGEKHALNINPEIVDHFLIEDEVPCDQPCPGNCGCYPKQLCNDLQTTQIINKVLINDIDYDETVTTTLLPNGELYKVTTTPVWNTVDEEIDYINKKEYIAVFDTATCGCIKPTETNNHLLAAFCWDLYCCYCTECKKTNTEFGGYRIFYETGTIHFDGSMIYDKFYLEYRGSLPKSGNEYLVPEIAYDTLIEITKWYAIRNKKGVPQWERRDQFDNYRTERSNMTKVMGRMKLEDIIHSAMLVPQFDYNSNGCYTPRHVPQPAIEQPITITTGTQYINVPSPAPSPARPTTITIEGTQMSGGITYTNYTLAGVPLLIFANPFNRYLTESEYTLLPTGGFTILTGVYGASDFFIITPKWWLI